MNSTHRVGRRVLARNVLGSVAAEAFVLIAIATILITRLYLELTDYPQIGTGDLHIAHALYGGALMMLALLLGWTALGFGARLAAITMGGIGFGLFLDEVGKFVTADNDYFFGPAAEIMYILVVVILVGSRVVSGIRPFSAREHLASAAAIAADGLAYGLADHRREIALRLVDTAEAGGSNASDVAHVRALLESADGASDRLHRTQEWAPRLIPGFFRSPRWVPIVGWLLVLGSIAGVVFGVLGMTLGGYLYERHGVTLRHDGMTPAEIVLLVSAGLTAGLALPAMIGRRQRPESLWPLRWLRNSALVFTFLNALVDFATDGFGALLNMSIGLFALLLLTYQLEQQARGAIGA